MGYYYQLGTVPPKRHTQFRKADGGLHAEEVYGTEGFTGIQSILYHLHPPTQVSRVAENGSVALDHWGTEPLRHHLFHTKNAERQGDPISGRQTLMFNDDCTIGVCLPKEPMPYFYRNAYCDEVLFIHEGTGTLLTNFGRLPYHKGDYLIIPRGVTYQLGFDDPDIRMLVVEGRGPIEVPKRYRNDYGQMLEHAPYCERDFRPPEALDTHNEKGEFEVRIKTKNHLSSYYFAFHPFDVVGWDGYLYPWAFNIGDFEPITGRIHQPPPVHQTFQGQNFVLCSFCPRKLDYHPLSIPVPYNHSNIDSFEMIYYVTGRFGSRRGVDYASITLHPSGIPHGPHPGTVEASLGKEFTDELAVMVDTFYPLHLTKAAQGFDDPKYPYSWLPETDGAAGTTTG